MCEKKDLNNKPLSEYSEGYVFFAIQTTFNFAAALKYLMPITVAARSKA
jgi:hypothetical protein